MPLTQILPKHFLLVNSCVNCWPIICLSFINIINFKHTDVMKAKD